MAAKKATDQLGEFNSHRPFPPDAEKLLQEEIMKLSLKDRNDYQEEIHGVKIIAKEETPELLKESLHQLDAKLHSPSFPHFLKSQQKLPTYVNTEAFRLRFLRSALFDVSSAAKQINDYLEHATSLFGDEILQRPIRISDFSKEELREFRKGRFQFLPYRDRAGKRGRRIFVVLPDQEWESMSWNLKRKIRMYMTYVAAEDIEAQKYGIVVIVWVDKAWMDVARSPWYKENIKPMGTRFASVHFCTPDTPKHRFFRSLFALRLNKERARLQIHVGQASTELMYKLLSFGIPVHYIPVSSTGKIKDKYIKEWIRLRQLIEDERMAQTLTSQRKCSMIETPYSDDIVFRNGTSLISHPGNSSLRTMVAMKLMNGGSKNTKDVTEEIMSEITGIGSMGGNGGGRILIWDEKGWWKEAPAGKDDDEVHKKISRIVRDTRKLLSTNSKTSQYNAKTSQRDKSYMFVEPDVTGSSKKRQKMCFG